MFGNWRNKVLAGLLAAACAFSALGVWANFGFAFPAVQFATAESGDTSSVAQSVTPSPQGEGETQGEGEGQGEDEAQGEGEYSLEIYSNNLSFSDSIYILYAVTHQGFERAEYPIRLLFWDAPQDEYVLGTESYSVSKYYQATVRSNDCAIFYSNGLAAKQMTDNVYARACVEIDGVVYYSQTTRFSALEYVYNRRENSSLDSATSKLFEKMLDYGAAAQEKFEYALNTLANATYFKVDVVNGSFAVELDSGSVSDGFDWGRYVSNTKITLTANLDVDKNFLHWIDESGTIISESMTVEVTLTASHTYTAVYESPFVFSNLTDQYGKLMYKLEQYNGSATDLVIPSEVDGIPVYAISANAFKGCNSLQSVTISDGIVKVGKDIFASCKNLKTIRIPASVVAIDDNFSPFYGSPALQEIIVDKGNAYYESLDGNLYTKGGTKLLRYAIGKTATDFVVPAITTEIGDHAFRNAIRLKNLFVHSAVSAVGVYAVRNCPVTVYAEAESQPEGWVSNWNPDELTVVWGYKPTDVSAFEYTVVDNATVTITKYVGEDADVVIPSTIDGLPVTAIGESAFEACAITSVTIPEGVVTIGYKAFAFCDQLTSVEIPYGVLEIGQEAFTHCEKLEQWAIPNSVTTIGKWAFNGIAKTTEYVIPDSVMVIGACAFMNNFVREQFVYCQAESKPDGWDDGWYYGTDESTASIVYWYSENEPALNAEGSAYDGDYWRYVDGVPTVWTFTGTAGLVYTLNSEGMAYSVTGYEGTDTDVIIPANYEGLPVTAIGDEAFYNCSSLTSVVIGDSVTSIGYGAFQSCSGLTSVVIPDSVTSIGSGVFSACDGLMSVEIGDGVTSIGDNAFDGCSSLTSVVIPDSVTSIGDWAFQCCSSLTSVVIPNSVTSIGSGVFSACDGLMSVEIPESVTSIGDWAFQCCSSLTSVEIPDSVTSVGSYAFAWCSYLTSVEIPDSVTSIGDGAFLSCRSLTSITVDENNTAYKDIDGNLYTKDGGTLIQYAIGKTATEFIIPDSVTSIGWYAFYNCSSLTSVVIGDNVTSIGSRAFYGCSSLTSVVIGDNVTSIGADAFLACSSLMSVVIPDGVTSIGESAFNQCSSLTSVVIPDSVTSIGSYAFYNCSNLTIYCEAESQPSGWNSSWNNSNRPVVWGYKPATPASAFEYSIANNKVTITKYVGDYTEVVIPATIEDYPVTSIGNDAFAWCSSLTSVEIPDSVTSIGWYAFAYCSGLTSVEIPDSVTGTGNYAFYDCSSLTSVVIPDGVTSIDIGAFSLCTNLTSVRIPESVTGIGASAFFACRNLTRVEIPAAVNTIGNVAFGDCSALTSISVSKENAAYQDIDGNLYTKDGVNLIQYAVGKTSTEFVVPDGVTSIGAYAFSSCSSLTSVEIPDSVTSIGEWVFSSCSSLTSVEIPDDVTSIGGYAFSGCSSLTSVVIGDSVTSIGSYAFVYCSSLTSVVIGDSVTSVGDDAFAYCSSLQYNEYDNACYLGNEKNPYTVLIQAKATDITACNIHTDTKVIYNSAFYNCSNLTSVVIPDSVTSIGAWAFDSCSGLTSVVIPDGVTSIGSIAFANCSSLTIYCEAESQPSGWNSSWNYSNCPVVWGYVPPTPASAFTYSISNEEVTITNYVGDYTDVVIPATIEGCSVTKIGDRAFYDNSSLTSVTFPDTLVSVGNYAFNSCTGLRKLVIPDSVTSLGTRSFWGCNGLTSLTLGTGVTQFKDAEFAWCSSLTELVVPEGVTKVGYDAFRYCEGLVRITLPESLEIIGDCSFSHCTSLMQITIPDSVTTIARQAFSACSALNKIVVGKNVTTIGYNAFENCGSLTSMVIPESVTSIGSYAFYQCSNLTIYCKAESQPSGWDSDWNYSNRPVVWGYKEQ